MSEDLRDRPVFICGHPKSGTSLLRALLDSHPQLVVYPEETVFFREFLPGAADQQREALLHRAEDRLIHIFAWNQTSPPAHQRGFPDRDYTQISYEAVREALQRRLGQRDYRHPGDVLSAAVLAFGEVSGQLTDRSHSWVEKSPYNEQYVREICGWWPAARFLHIVRDPRDNYLSYRRKHPEWRVETLAYSWTRSTRQGLENRRLLGEDRYLLIGYEDLVGKFAATMAGIRRFLGIDDDPRLAIPTRAGVHWGGNSMFEMAFKGISQKSVGRWKNALPAIDAGVIQTMAGSEMRELGYETGAGVPLQARWRAARWRVGRWRAARRTAAEAQPSFYDRSETQP